MEWQLGRRTRASKDSACYIQQVRRGAEKNKQFAEEAERTSDKGPSERGCRVDRHTRVLLRHNEKRKSSIQSA